MADATVWGTIVSLLATFNITKAKDKDGNIIEVEEKYSDALIRCVTSILLDVHLTSLTLHILRLVTPCPLNVPLCLDPRRLKDWCSRQYLKFNSTATVTNSGNVAVGLLALSKR